MHGREGIPTLCPTLSWRRSASIRRRECRPATPRRWHEPTPPLNESGSIADTLQHVGDIAAPAGKFKLTATRKATDVQAGPDLLHLRYGTREDPFARPPQGPWGALRAIGAALLASLIQRLCRYGTNESTTTDVCAAICCQQGNQLKRQSEFERILRRV
jgi:hypothetical protein